MLGNQDADRFSERGALTSAMVCEGPSNRDQFGGGRTGDTLPRVSRLTVRRCRPQHGCQPALHERIFAGRRLHRGDLRYGRAQRADEGDLVEPTTSALGSARPHVLVARAYRGEGDLVDAATSRVRHANIAEATSDRIRDQAWNRLFYKSHCNQRMRRSTLRGRIAKGYCDSATMDAANHTTLTAAAKRDSSKRSGWTDRPTNWIDGTVPQVKCQRRERRAVPFQ